MAAINTMNPTKVSAAVSNPQFYAQQQSFWQMLCYLFTDYQGKKVHSFLPVDTFRKICLQTHALIESIEPDDYTILESNKALLYHTYFVVLKNIRAQKTITRMTVDETPDLLMALYQLYKRLLQLKPGPMPLFAHPLS